MLNLDLDDEIVIEEDDKSECVLCQYTNHTYLDHMHSALNCTTSKSNLYDILAFSTPFLTRLLLYLGKVCTISDESCLIVGMAASAMSRVMIVSLSDAFTRVNDFAILSMSNWRKQKRTSMPSTPGI